MLHRDAMSLVMKACIVLNNMIIEDNRDESDDHGIRFNKEN